MKKIPLNICINGKLETVGVAEVEVLSQTFHVTAHVYPGSVLARRLAEVGTADFSFDLEGVGS